MKKLDDIVRRKLQEVDYPYEEDHWLKLEERLPDRNRRFTPWSLAAGIVILIGVIFIYNGTTLNKKLKAISNSKDSRDNISANSTEKPPVVKHDRDTVVQMYENKNIAVFSSAQTELIDSKVNIEVKQLGKNTGVLMQTLVAPSLSSLPDDSKSMPLESIKMFEPISLLRDSISFLPESLEKLPTQMMNSAFHLPEITEPAYIQPEKKKVPTRRRDLGNLALVIGPDLTSVRGAGESRFSSNVGLLYSRPISKRVSISAGLIYAQKKYKSSYSFYQPTKPITGAYEPTDVEAICQVFSVPLTLNYTVWQKNGQQIQLNVGASSYFMLREKYNMKYETGYEHVYEIKGDNQHYFGLADFSVTYLRQIHSRYQLGLRPFVQIPLTGIGYGNVPLQSQGIALIISINGK